MIRLRSGLAVAALALGCAMGDASVAESQIPPSVELRVPKPPTVAAGSDGGFLAWELHVTNLTGRALQLAQVEVFDATSGERALLTMGDSALVPAVWRPGPAVPEESRTAIAGGMRAVVYLWLPIDTAAAPSRVGHRVTLLQDTVRHVIEGADVGVQPAGFVLGPPLRGQWFAANGPSNASGHRRLVMGLNGNVASAQRFGADFLAVRDDGSFADDEADNASYHGYGADVLAVADAVVVETKDRIPENVPGINSRAVAITLETVSGNSIVLDLGDGRFAFYAHLIPGSLRVREGDRVTRGQVIGSVGNSGNSTAPHLHFHVVDSPAPGTSTLGAEGIPYALEQFELVGHCTGFDPESCTRGTPRTIRNAIPLQNQIVRFPE